MALSQSELDEMDQISGLSEQEFNDMDNIANGIEQPQEPIKAGISVDITPSGIYKGSQNVVGSAIAAPFVAKKDNISVKDAFNQNMDKVREWRKENPTPFQDFAVDTAAYSLIPASRAAGLPGFVSNVARFGALPGALEGLKNGIGDSVKGALGGSAIVGGIQAALPPVMQGVGRGLQKITENPNVQRNLAKTIEILTSVPEKFSKTAIGKELAGNSLFKGKFNPETAYQGVERKLRTAKGMLPNKQQYQKQYKDLGNKVREKLSKTVKPESYYNEQLYNQGQKALDNIQNLDKKMAEKVAEAVENLPSDVSYSAKDLKQIVDDVYNSYSVSGNKTYNPAFNNGGDKTYQEIIDLIENKKGDYTGDFKKAIDELKYPNGKYDMVTNRYKNQYHAKQAKNLNNDIVTANRRFNNEILGNLKQNPGWVTDPKKIEALENQISSYSVPEEYQQEMFNKLYEAINKGELLENRLSPKEMVDLYRTIGEKPNWEALNEKTKNEILEKIYNRFSGLTKELSPELKEANDFYSKYMQLKKNTGGLNPSTIAGKLKNYGSDSQILAGTDKALRDINSLLPEEQRFLGNVEKLNNQLSAQNQLSKNLPESVLNDLSKYQNAPLAVQNELEKFAPEEINILRDIMDRQATQNDILKTISGQAYERNPRLLSNRNDLKAEEALNYLQENSGINFMNDLEEIRAREALEKWFPGQGGGSGTGQGFGNLLRTAIIGGAPTTAALTGNLGALAGLALVSPKFTGQNLIKGLGNLNKLGKNLINLDEVYGNVARRVVPASLIAPWE